MSEIDFDSPWKAAIEQYFEEFVAFFFPRARAEIDWARGYEFLDRELQQVTRDAEIGRRLADKLVKLWLRDGEEVWMLAHIEVQGQYEPQFPRRLFVYNYRIYDRYRREVVTLTVLGDERGGDRGSSLAGVGGRRLPSSSRWRNWQSTAIAGRNSQPTTTPSRPW